MRKHRWARIASLVAITPIIYLIIVGIAFQAAVEDYRRQQRWELGVLRATYKEVWK